MAISKPLKVLVVGCGNMGKSHARAYHNLDGFELSGLVVRNPGKIEDFAASLANVPVFNDFDRALADIKPDVVSINTYPDTHATFAEKSLLAGAHLFIEKPLAETVEGAERIASLATRLNKKVVVGYILRVHPAWKKFIGIAHTLGKPLVIRMNLNQQSSGKNWQTHKNLMTSMSPIVDCGVHYVDVMCQMTGSKPVKVSAIGAHLSDEINTDMYNYGQLQVKFEDGSVGWYEAGWGPMMSETAFFIKDVVGPKGCVSFVEKTDTQSQDLDEHTKVGVLKYHHSELNQQGRFVKQDELIEDLIDPGHDKLCELEQQVLFDTIVNDLSLEKHLQDAINSLRVVLAADRSVKTGVTIEL